MKKYNMLDFGGVNYFLDLDALDVAITLKSGDLISTQTVEKKGPLNIGGGKPNVLSTKTITTVSPREKEIDATKYEILRTMLELVIDYQEDSDASLGVDKAFEDTPLSYKIAFNTLLNYGILKEEECEDE